MDSFQKRRKGFLHGGLPLKHPVTKKGDLAPKKRGRVVKKGTKGSEKHPKGEVVWKEGDPKPNRNAFLKKEPHPLKKEGWRITTGVKQRRRCTAQKKK